MDQPATGSDTTESEAGDETATPDERPARTEATDRDEAATRTPTAVARDLLVAYRSGGPPDRHLATLSAFDEADLTPVRDDRPRALAFWLNLYNAGTQRLLAERSGLYESPLRIVRFFSATCVTVAGTQLSLDDIEQGILRGRSKYGLGYLPRLLPGGFERRHRLTEPDPRIHFALNCGAASCPAIRAYEPDRIDDQLDLATRTYLDATVEYDPDSGTVRIPRVFLWYRGDFGGRRGIRSFLRRYEAIPADARPRLRYRSWDWSRAAGKFA
jgi:hypothetical protein